MAIQSHEAKVSNSTAVRLPMLAVGFSVSILLSACGGGGGGGGDDTSDYTVSGVAGSNGAVSPSSRTVSEDASTTFTITPDSGFEIDSVSGCGGSLSGNTFTTGAITADCTVTANFVAIPPSDRFVISGNADGTLSLMLVDAVAGFARAIGYANISSFAVRDMHYDAGHSRLVAITDNELHTLSVNGSTGELQSSDSGSTSGSSSHMALNADGDIAYVASGTNDGFIDIFTLNADGTFGSPSNFSVSVDPDYLAMNPDGDQLYLVSRNNDQIQFFDINPDGSLATSPGTFNTDENPSSLLFHDAANVAYVTYSDSNSNATLQVLIVDTGGALAQGTQFFDVGNNPIDMVLDEEGANLYVLDGSSARLHHFSVNTTTGDLTFVEFTSLDFSTATDLTLSNTGQQLYVGHDDDLVATLDVDDSNGTLTEVEYSRIFEGSRSVAAIGGAGALQPTATFLLSPDTSGLSRFSVDASGNLTLSDTLSTSSALIDGQVAVEYLQGLLLATGENDANEDLVTSYSFDPVTGATTAEESHTATGNENGIDSNSSFQRIEIDRSGRAIYVLDEDIFDSSASPRPTGFVRVYNYDEFGNFSTTADDVQSVGEGPENMTLHPSGRFLYSINSFGDDIDRININKSDASLSFGATYFPASGINSQTSGRGRPIDMQFHPNGRYAYVSLQDEHQMVRFSVASNGTLSSPVRENPPQEGSTDVGPGPIGVHPTGRFVYVGERSTNTIAMYTVSPSDYSLTYQSRVSFDAAPSWIEIDPKGEFLIARGGSNIEVYSINQTTGAITNTEQTVVAGTGSGGFLATLTLVTPLQEQ